MDATDEASLEKTEPEKTRRGGWRLFPFGGRNNRTPEPVVADEESERPSITSTIREIPPAEEGLTISVARALAELEPVSTEFTPDEPAEFQPRFVRQQRQITVADYQSSSPN